MCAPITAGTLGEMNANIRNGGWNTWNGGSKHRTFTVYSVNVVVFFFGFSFVDESCKD